MKAGKRGNRVYGYERKKRCPACLHFGPMDEIGETTPNLAHGEATATAGIASVQGVKAGAVEFDNAEYFTQTIYDAINVGEGDFTAELWVKSTDDDGYLFCIGTHNTTNVEGGTGNWIGLERKNGYLSFSIDDNADKAMLLRGTV